MSPIFESIRNFHESAVFEAVLAELPNYPQLDDEGLLADVACVALNRLQPRYIRHEVDFLFYRSDREREATERDVAESVKFAFEYVQARNAMLARG